MHLSFFSNCLYLRGRRVVAGAVREVHLGAHQLLCSVTAVIIQESVDVPWRRPASAPPSTKNCKAKPPALIEYMVLSA